MNQQCLYETTYSSVLFQSSAHTVLAQLSLEKEKILELHNSVETLTNDYQNNLNESMSLLAEKRIQVSAKCAEAANDCLKQTLAKFFRVDAIWFAYHGVRMNPSNSECFDILINLFQLEIEEAEERMKKRYFRIGQNSNEDNTTDLMTLVDKDIEAVSGIGADEVLLGHV